MILIERLVKSFHNMVKAPVFWQAMVCFAFYWLLTLFVPFSFLIELLNGIIIVLSAAIIIAYWQYVRDILFGNMQITLEHQLVLGIVVAFFSVLCSRVMLVLWRYWDQPFWVLNNYLWGFFVYLAILAAVLHLTPEGAIRGEVPRDRYVKLGFAIGLGIMLAIVFYISVEQISLGQTYFQR